MTGRFRLILGASVLLLLVGWIGSRLPGRGEVSAMQAAATAGDWAAAEAALAPLEEAALPPSATALANAGLVAWNRDDPAAALAAWRAASERAPRDVALAEAIARARAAWDTRPRPVHDRPGWTGVLTPDELGGLATVLWALSSLLAVRARQDQTPPGPAVGAGLLALALSTLCVSVWATTTGPLVVSRADTAGRPMPDPGTEPVVTWPGGTELRVEQRRAPFVRVVDGTGRTAWIASDAVAWPPGTHADGP